MELPTGTVTFLFTDIEGSTRLWDEHPEEMRAALARHEALLRHAIEAQGGHVFHTSGDAFCVVFSRATDALTAALDAQRALQAEPWGAVAALKARMALHTGEAEEREGDYFGPPLNRCSRLLNAGHGGQVLLSRTSAHIVREALPEGAGLRPLGEHRLRDLTQPEDIFQLAHPDLPAEFPPLRSLAAFRHNLPVQLTSFIGREQELEEVEALLSTTHLLTLTGTGGAGKTALALHVGVDLLDEYPDGVWLVELAVLSEPSLVLQAVLSAAGVREEPQRSLLDTLTDALRPKRLLLILDNCEHLVDACAALAEHLLHACPDLRILASSREALRAEGEVVWRVPSLPAPAPAAQRSELAATLTQYAAVRLFIDRAAAASPGFRVTNDNASAVARVCWRLDGIPLAIELAAARTNVLAPEEIERRLGDRFRLLTGGRRSALPRQRTLWAAVDWSYGLLPEAERRLFGRLSVFAGGFDLPSAQAVAATPDTADWQVLDLLGSLVARSLVVPDEGPGTRYRLLETLRAYGWERLRECGEAELTAARHAEFFMALAEKAKSNLAGPEQVGWLQRLELEHDNLRGALAWGSRHDPDAGARLAGALLRLWEIRGHWTEGRDWFRQYLAEDLDPARRAEALSAAGRLALRQGDAAQAHALAVEGVEVYRQLGDRRGEADCLSNLAALAGTEGDWPASRRLHGQALAIRRQLGLKPDIARSLHGLALVAQEQGDLPTAWPLYEEALALYGGAGDRSGIAQVLNNLGNIAVAEGDRAAARALHEESLAIRRELGEPSGIQMSLGNLASLAQSAGDYAAARAMFEETLAINRELGDRRSVADGLRYLAEVASAEGKHDEARTLFLESLALGEEVGARAVALDCLHGLAAFESKHGRAALAARLFGVVDAVTEQLGLPVDSVQAATYQAQIAATRAALGEEAFQAAWAEGRAMTLDEAVAYALREGSDA